MDEIIFRTIENKSIKSSEIASALNFFNIFNSIFGFKVDSAMNVPESVRELLIARNEARINKDWSLSDRIRNQIKNEVGLLSIQKMGEVQAPVIIRGGTAIYFV